MTEPTLEFGSILQFIRAKTACNRTRPIRQRQRDERLAALVAGHFPFGADEVAGSGGHGIENLRSMLDRREQTRASFDVFIYAYVHGMTLPVPLIIDLSH